MTIPRAFSLFSDPTTSPNGTTRVLVWERRGDEPPKAGGAAHARLVFRIDRGGVTAAGPFHVRLTGEAVKGADPCIRVLDQWVFLAFHDAGNLYLLRLDHTVPYTEAPDWTPMGVPGANVAGHVNYDPPDTPESNAPCHRGAYVGPGWLANLDGSTVNGQIRAVISPEAEREPDVDSWRLCVFARSTRRGIDLAYPGANKKGYDTDSVRPPSGASNSSVDATWVTHASKPADPVPSLARASVMDAEPSSPAVSVNCTTTFPDNPGSLASQPS